MVGTRYGYNNFKKSTTVPYMPVALLFSTRIPHSGIREGHNIPMTKSRSTQILSQSYFM
jgi:hypothetical protein